LRKEKYASKIKSAQETQQTQENYASKNNSTHAQVTQLLALRAFEWKPGFTLVGDRKDIRPHKLCTNYPSWNVLSISTPFLPSPPV